MQYKIEAVSPETRDYDTKFGAMRSYRLRLEGYPQPVELGQKVATPPPSVGQTIDGSIDDSGPYGPKFKKEYSQGGNFGGGSSSTPQSSSTATPSSSLKPGFNSDPFTMYLSYAKDIAVALISREQGYDDKEFAKILEDVLHGGEVLYEGRPGGEPTSSVANKPKDNLPDDNFDGSKPLDAKALDDVFGKGSAASLEDVPFN